MNTVQWNGVNNNQTYQRRHSFDSPVLGRRNPEQYRQQITGAVQAILHYTPLRPIRLPSSIYELSQFYQYDFLNPSAAGMPLKDFEALKFLVQKIDAALVLASHLDFNKVTGYISQLLRQPDTGHLLSELGMIYFYLDKHQNLLGYEQFTLCREKEMEQQISVLKKNAHPQLPSGETAYLLRAFGNMVIDSEGKCNRGGIYAALRLLKGPLGSGFTNEHLEHVVSIFEHLLSNDALVTLLESEVNPHHSMRPFIRIMLKLGSAEELTQIHIRLALLLALVEDPRQFTQPNCFAVGPLCFKTITNPCSLLEKYQDYVSKGYVEVVGRQIPLPPLFMMRLHDRKAMGVRLSVPEIKASCALQVAFKAMGVVDPVFDPHKTWTVEECFSLISAHSLNPKQCRFLGTATLGSFTRNPLQQMYLAILEFFEANESDITFTVSRDGSIQERAVKRRFVRFIQEAIVQQIKKIFPERANTMEVICLLNDFEAAMQTNFWLQNNHGGLEKNPDGTIKLFISENQHTLSNFRGDIQQLQKVMADHHRRLIYLNGEDYNVVDSSTELRKTLQTIVQDVRKKREENGLAIPPQDFFFQLDAFLRSDIIAEHLYRFLPQVNQLIPLNQQDYRDSKIIIFAFEGACTLDIPIKQLELNCISHRFSTANPLQSMVNMLNYFYNLPQKDQFLDHKQVVLCKSRTHVCLLTPSRFAPLWQEDPSLALENYGYALFHNLLQKPLTNEQIINIFSNTFADPTLGAIWQVSFHTSPFGNTSTAAQLIAYFNQCSAFQRQAYGVRFMQSIALELTSIDCMTLNWEGLLTKLTLIKPENKIELGYQLRFALAAGERYKQPIAIAGVLQQELAKYRCFYTELELERILCDEYQIPRPWILGDLNWGDNTEGPIHHTIVLKPLWRSSLQLCVRIGDKETLMPPQLFNSFIDFQILHA